MKTLYRFHRCQTHPRCPDLEGWYLELCPDDHVTLMRVHRGVVAVYYHKFGTDPHVQANETQRIFYNPAFLGGKWLEGIQHFGHETVLVNSNGGMMPYEAEAIRATLESETLEWPDHWDDEVVTIARWPEGHHYYLSSSRDRLFVPDKHPVYTEARKAALRYVPADRVKGNC